MPAQTLYDLSLAAAAALRCTDPGAVYEAARCVEAALQRTVIEAVNRAHALVQESIREEAPDIALNRAEQWEACATKAHDRLLNALAAKERLERQVRALKNELRRVKLQVKGLPER